MPTRTVDQGIKVSFNADQVYKLMGRMRSNLDGNERRSLMNQIAGIIYSISRDSFKKASDPVTGAKWKPLAPWWREWKAKKGFSTNILVMRAEMGNSGRPQSGVSFARVIYSDRKSSLHQMGGSGYNPKTGARFKVPQRRFLGLSNDDQRYIVGLIDKAFEKATKT